MEWVIIIVILVIFTLFLILWFSGVFNTKTYTRPPSNSKQIIQDNINILMPPSTWGTPIPSGGCLIYNFPIVNSQFPTITNNAVVIEDLNTTTSNRCYWSNELALQKTSRRCLIDGCSDDLGNIYNAGEQWSYYGPCGNSCYATGEMLGLLVIGLESTEFKGPYALEFLPDSTIGTTTNIDIQNASLYHRLIRYDDSKASRKSTNGRYCNIIHTEGNITYYMTTMTVEYGDYTYIKPTYTKVKPGKSLWFMAPPNSIGGTPQAQKLVFVDGYNMGLNPSLNAYASAIQSQELLSISYGFNIFINPPLEGIYMIDAMMPIDMTRFTSNIQFIDISRFDIMIGAKTTEYPFYMWSGV